MFNDFIKFVREYYNSEEFIPLHAPQFIGNEKKYLNDCIDSTFVSSVGQYVDRFESEIAAFTGAKHAVAVTNGTAALHIALHSIGTDASCEIITQPLTFVATANAIHYTGASPIFLDVDLKTLGLSSDALQRFLENSATIKEGRCINKSTGRTIKACIPMHTFGFPCELIKIAELCAEWKIDLIEDAAESLGSYIGDRHTGTLGKLGTLSFNGNKVITAGGGGAVLTNDELLAKKIKHLTTTAKIPHRWEYNHDAVGFNYRMPNLNAALLCAQLEQLPVFLKEKRVLADLYRDFFANTSIDFKCENPSTKANFWLNTIQLNSLEERNEFLAETNEKGIMTRPIWKLMNDLGMYSSAQKDELVNSKLLVDTIVNIPSSPNL